MFSKTTTQKRKTKTRLPMSIKAIRLKPEQVAKVSELAGKTTELNEAAILRMSITAGLPRVEKLIADLNSDSAKTDAESETTKATEA